MVARISSYRPQLVNVPAKLSSKATRIAFMVLAFLAVALTVALIKALKGRAQSPSREFPIIPPPAPLPVIRRVTPNIAQLKEALLKTIPNQKNMSDDYSIILQSVLNILEKEEGIIGVSEEEFVYRLYNGYPYALVAALGGEGEFDQLPILKVTEENLKKIQEGINDYLQIDPSRMAHPIMRGHDTLERPFLAVRYRDTTTGGSQADIFLCRDPKDNRWYQNEERSPERFSLQRGHSIHFIARLLKDSHPKFKLG